MKICYLRPDRLAERAMYRPRALAQAFNRHEFLIVHPRNWKRKIGRSKVGIVFVCGNQVADQARNLIQRATIRVYFPQWSPENQCTVADLREIRRGKYHVIFTEQPPQVGLLKRAHKNVRLIHKGFDPKVFYPAPEEEKTRWIVFAGESRKFGRGRRLKKLRKKFPGRVEWTSGMDHAGMAAFYRSGRICWDQVFQPGSDGGVNYRAWETMGCGLMLLCNYNSSVAKLFKDRVHVVFWKNDRDMLDRAAYYLQHETERQKIAKAGY